MSVALLFVVHPLCSSALNHVVYRNEVMASLFIVLTLYASVRGLAGALVDVGIGKLAPGEISRILKSAKRSILIPTAPSRGLTLEKVYYRPRK